MDNFDIRLQQAESGKITATNFHIIFNQLKGAFALEKINFTGIYIKNM